MSQWELLVTDGHVRAARWRNAAPGIFVGAVVAILAGVLLGTLAPERAPSTRVSEAKEALVDRQRTVVSSFIERAGEIDAVPARAGMAATPEAAATQIAAVVASLNANGRLPAAQEAERPEVFWRGAWEPGRLHTMRRDRTVILGQYVAVIPGTVRQPPVLARQYVVIRRGTDGAWRSYCLAVADYAPCDGERLDPASIPATLRPFLPRGAFAEGGAG
jgi:hypothetical protein